MAKVDTEKLASRSLGLDTWPNRDVLSVLWQDQMDGVAAVRAVIPAIEQAALAAVEFLRNPESRLIYAGAGSSGVLAGLDGLELPCTFGWAKERLLVHRADDKNGMLAIETPGDDEDDVALETAENTEIGPNDVIVAVSASGNTPYTCTFAEHAKKRGALVIAIAHNAGSRLLMAANQAIFLDTGPETIAGSTRLKAGTAQKAALGMFSTLVMTRLGHVHDGMMVDMVPENDKLRERAARMVADIAEVDLDTARAITKENNGHIKTAVLVAKGLTPDKAGETLKECDNVLRAALERIAQP